jgi:hypothetical protein
VKAVLGVGVRDVVKFPSALSETRGGIQHGLKTISADLRQTGKGDIAIVKARRNEGINK